MATKWNPLLEELIEAAVREPNRARELVKNHPESLELRTGLGETAMHYLAVENYAEAVQLLLELGSNVNTKNMFGQSALLETITVHADEACAVLRRAGAIEPTPKELEELM